MVCKQVMIVNPSGLHARPASEFVREAKRFLCSIKIRNLDIPEEEEAVNAKNIMAVLSLGIGPGCHVELSAEGEDEEAALDSLTALIGEGLGESVEVFPAEEMSGSDGEESPIETDE